MKRDPDHNASHVSHCNHASSFIPYQSRAKLDAPGLRFDAASDFVMVGETELSLQSDVVVPCALPHPFTKMCL